MRSRGLSQGQLASELGVSGSTVARWIAGSVPRPRALMGLCELLEVRPEWILGEDGIETQQNACFREDPGSYQVAKIGPKPHEMPAMIFPTMSKEELLEAHVWFGKLLLTQETHAMRKALVSILDSIADAISNHNRTK